MQVPRGLRVRMKRLAYGRAGAGRDGERVVARLDVRPGMRVADIGSGFGDYALRFGVAVGRDGVVYAVDTDDDLRAEVARAASQRGLPQVVPIAASADDPALPTPVDLAFLSSSFHHLPDRRRYLERTRDHLRAGGRVAILEGRPGLLTGWFGHATAPEEVRTVLESAGFHLLARDDDVVGFASLQVFAPAGPAPGRDDGAVAADVPR